MRKLTIRINSPPLSFKLFDAACEVADDEPQLLKLIGERTRIILWRLSVGAFGDKDPIGRCRDSPAAITQGTNGFRRCHGRYLVLIGQRAL